MNKSKFLKKSLAMLLALMLVLAMIPLSASAAQTDYINYLYVNGQNAAVDGDGYSVTVGTEKVTLKASLSDNVRLLYVDNQGEKKTVEANGSYIDLADGYTTGTADEYALTIIAMVKENPDVSDEETEYTYNVTVKVSAAADSTNTALQGLADGNETWPNMLDWSVDNTAKKVNVLLKFGAVNPTKGAAAEPILDATDFATVDPEAEVTVVDDTHITVTAENDSSATYELVFTHEAAFDSFTIPDQMGDTEFTYGSDNANYIDIKVPYGYSAVDIIPTFALAEDLAEEDLIENNGSKVYTSGVTAITNFGQTNGINTNTNPWTYQFAIATADYNGDAYTSIDLRITYVEKNPAGDLLAVKVTDKNNKSSNTTEVTATGVVNVEMPVDGLKSGDGFTATLTVSKDATVTTSTGTVDTSRAPVADNPLAQTVTINNIDLGEGNSFSINVKSEDGKVTNVYNINLNKAATAEAKLTSVTFKDKGDNNKLYRAKIDNTTAEEGTVTLTVPYSWKNTSTLSDVLVYMTASTGATITHSKITTSTWTEANNGVLTLDKQIGGAGNNWFPYPDAASEANATSQVVVTNVANGETVQRTYTIKIETETAEGGRTIESLNFSSEEKEKDITADNTFSAKLGTAKLDDGSTTGTTVNTIEVTVPYSWEDIVTNKTVYLYQLAMSTGAKLYDYASSSSWSDGNEKHAVDAEGNLSYGLNIDGKFDAVTNGELDKTKAIPVRVLSEANGTQITEVDGNEVTNALNNGPYTEYWIYFVEAPAETGAELLSIESVDENVTVTLKDRVITVNVPNSYPTSPVLVSNPETFALKFTTSKQAKVYEEYNKADNTVDNQLVSEKSLFGVYDQNGELYVVKATSTNTNGNIQLTGDPIKDGEPAESKVGAIYVRSEDGKTTNAYTVKLVINKVETGADVTALSVNGTAATIARDQINVRLPLGTKLYPVTLDIDASKMATVYVSPTNVTDPATQGDTYLYDPEARYDVNRPLKITVVAEDGETSKIYTLTATVADSFNDVPTSEWYYDEVMTAANAGWINGTKPGYFEPNGTMTRGDFAVIIARILGCDTEATVESKFPDCNETDYFNAAVTFCKLRGIIDGDDKGYFNPYDAITREEMAKILCNALELDELETSANPFDDDAEIAQWAKGYVNAVQAEGIMEGSNGSFNPRDNATRAEGAAVLVRAFANA